MTIKDLEEYFLVDIFFAKTNKGQYLLSEKVASMTGRSPHKFLCVIHKKGSNSFFVVGNKPTNNLDTLKNQVEDYVKSLPYDSDYYNPRFVAGLKEELIIHDYLKGLGFKGEDSEFYVLKEQNVYKYTSQKISMSLYGINHRGGGFSSWNDKDTISEEVRVVLHTGEYSWVESTVKREVEEIKKAIDSMLKPLFVSDSAYNFSKSEQLKNAGNIELYLTSLTKNLEHVSMDYKSTLKQKLLEMAAAL